jgi:hypothetical protein
LAAFIFGGAERTTYLVSETILRTKKVHKLATVQFWYSEQKVPAG